MSKSAVGDYKFDDLVHPLAGLQVAKGERPGAAHASCVAVHNIEAGADQRRQIDFVDDEEVGAGDAGSAFARDLVAGGDVDDVNRQIGELGGEGGGEVVAARLAQDQIEIREYSAHLGDRRQVDRGVLADRGVRTSAGLDAADPLGRQGAAAGQEFGILAGVDVVGDRGNLIPAAHPLAQPVHQRGLARSDRTADPEPQRIGHERNSLVYWVSCAIEASSTAKVALPNDVRSRVSAPLTAAAITGSSAARMRWPSVCPIIPRRKPAETRLDANASKCPSSAQSRGISACAVAAPAAAA